MATPRTRHGSYSGVMYLFVTILISIGGNLLFQSLLFPVFPYPMFISLVSCTFPALYAFTATRKGYGRDVWIKYMRIAPLMLLNSLLAGILYNWSLLLTSMSAVTVITSSSTLFSLLFSRILLKTPIHLSTVISIHLSIIGSVMVMTASSAVDEVVGDPSLPVILSDSETTDAEAHVLGCMLAFISSACSGLGTVLFQKLGIREVDAYLTISGTSGIAYTAVFLVINRMVNWESLQVINGRTSSDVAYILLVNGIVSSMIGTQCFVKALTRLSPVTVNVLWSVSIPLTVVVDYYRGQIHTVTASFLFGALLVLLSTVLVPIEQEQTDLSDVSTQPGTVDDNEQVRLTT